MMFDYFGIAPQKPDIFAGMPVIETPPDAPKLKLSKHVQVSDDFRLKYDAWLAQRFGFQEPLLKPNEAFLVNKHMLIMRPEMAAYIRDTFA